MKTVIFGCGFTGTHLLKLIPDAYCTELPELCKPSQIPFDFNDQTTWEGIPDFDRAIITFKMTDSSLAQSFSTMLKGKQVILLSSARNLVNSKPNEVISEENALTQNGRALAESHFGNSTIILYLGLIWGNERKIKDWISTGRIKNGEKFINLIHVDDLCKIIIHLLEHKTLSNNLLISDGKPTKWLELAKKLGYNLNKNAVGLESRKFNTSKLKGLLPSNFQFKVP